MRILSVLLISSLLLIKIVFSQSGLSINTSGTLADNSAIFDISSTTHGLLIPRMTTAQRNGITSPATSLLIFNTTTNCFEAYVNGSWYSVSCPPPCSFPATPTAGTSTSCQTSIVWSWNIVLGTTGYKWNTVNDYATATDLGISVSYTQTGLTCNSSYKLYVWAYNNCGNSSIASFIQTTSDCSSCSNNFTDSRDGQSYKAILIGNQCWMAHNLNYGTQIPQLTIQTTDQKWCYGDIISNCTTYGGLYQWNEATGLASGSGGVNCNPCGPTTCHGGVQGICPFGWHVPSHYEWTALEQSVCAQSPVGSNCTTNFPYDLTTIGWRGTTEGNKMKVSASYIPAWDGTNSSGFTCLAAGTVGGGSFNTLGTSSNLWTATELSAGVGWIRGLNTSLAQIFRGNYSNNSVGNSVRCIKD
jgi:uncharacterized protein (TIGR02145 family)